MDPGDPLRSWPRRGAARAVELVAARTRLLRLLRRAGGRPTVTLASMYAAAAGVPALNALAVGHLIATLAVPHTAGQRLVAAGLVAGLLLGDQANWLLRSVLKIFVVKRIDGSLRIAVRAVAAGLPGLDRLESPEFHDRAARAVDTGMTLDRTRTPGNAAVGQLELSFRMVGAVTSAVLLATFSPTLAIVLLVVSLTVRAMLRRQWMHLIDLMDVDVAGQRRVMYLAELAVTGAAKEVRLGGLSDWLGGRFRAAGVAVYGRLWRELWAVLHRQWWTLILVTGAAAAALAVPAAAVLSGRLDAARLITYVLAAWGIFTISNMGQEAYDIEYGLRGIRAADELLSAHQPDVDRTRTPFAPTTSDHPTVRFEDVTFTYPGAASPVLDRLSMTLYPGETLAVVGANGVGKTTFVKLLGGLYRPDSGRITVNGVDLADIDPLRWRQRLAVLFQDFVQYPATLRDNITLAAPEWAGGDDVVLDALERAGAGHLRDRLANGLDTLLWRAGAGGTDLSGGQWQRVALARVLFAVLAGRRILVLDEPTAHLDVRAEAEFHQQVVRRVAGVTTVLISHRLTTVRPADRIVVLRDGRVTEDGSHDQLMAYGGEYARFFTVQAEAFAAAERTDLRVR